MTWQRYNKNLRKSALLAEYFSFWTNLGHILSSVIDSHLGLRSKLIGYQYSEIIRAIFSVFCCGGDCMEDLNLYLKDVLTERPHTRVPLFGLSQETACKSVRIKQKAADYQRLFVVDRGIEPLCQD